MKRFKTICLSLLVVPWAACNKPKPISDAAGAANCACDEFPFPTACKSQCHLGNALVESVDLKQQTAVVRFQNGQDTQLKTVRLSELPTGVSVKAGSTFATLIKKNVAEPEKSQIVRFTRAQKP